MERTYTVSEAANIIGVSVKTLQRWDRDGKLVANRTPSNRRFYTENQLKKIEGDKTMDEFEKIAEKFINYLKNNDFDNVFHFVLNDGSNDFDFGTKVIIEFNTWTFVTGMYGDGSGTSFSLFTLEDDWKSQDWEDTVEIITNYFYDNYKDWNVILD